MGILEKENAKPTFKNIFSSLALSHIQHSLPYSKHVVFRVCAVNAAGRSDWSPYSSPFKTPAGAPKPPDEIYLTVSKLSETELLQMVGLMKSRNENISF